MLDLLVVVLVLVAFGTFYLFVEAMDKI